MLLAVGLPSAIGADPELYHVYVDGQHAAEARAQLVRYELEQRLEAQRRAAAFTAPPPRRHPHAVLGAVLYGGVISGIAIALAIGVGPLDAFWRGDLDSALVQRGEWWRAITALTLHTDAPHLLANLAAGIWFGVLAGRHLGPGVAWLLILIAAATSNLLEALLGPAEHRAVGASTAVFAALGVLAANSWGAHYPRAQRWAVRWGPLVVGVILLGWFGSEGERTDIVAHVGGFLLGVLAGAIASLSAVRDVIDRTPQWAAGLAALGAIAMAWMFALSSS